MARVETVGKFEALGRLAGSQRIPAHTPVSPDSVFSDPIWNMRVLVTLPGLNTSRKQWDFTTVPGYPQGFALALAEFAYARLYNPVLSHDREAAWLTVLNELGQLRAFAKFCVSEGIENFHKVDADIYTRYLQFLRFGTNGRKPKSPDRVRKIISSIYKLWDFRSSMSMPLPAMPFDQPFSKVFKQSRSSSLNLNATPIIPEEVFSPLMRAALNFVLEDSEEILIFWTLACDIWADWESFAENRSKPRRGSLKKHSQISNSQRNKLRYEFITQHVAGFAPEGRKENWKGLADLTKEVTALKTACTLVIFAFSGMRASEVLSIRRGCIRCDVGSDGRERYYIDAFLYKHRGNGARHSWVVTKEVAQAVELLEVLTEPLRAAADDDCLFLTDGKKPFSVGKNYSSGEYRTYTFEALICQFAEFAKFCNTYLDRPSIPDWPDKQSGELKAWKPSSRQFRSTLAPYIAREPFGVIAGMRQYKHEMAAVFEGYAGSEQSYNKKLEDEKVLASVDIMEELAIDLTDGAVAGGFGDDLKGDFKHEFRGRAEDYHPSQIAKWLVSRHKNLFVGKFNFCFFDPAKALCLNETSDRTVPVLNACDPGRCSNSCVSGRHKPLWEAQIEQAQDLASYPKVPACQREALDQEIRELRFVVDGLGRGRDER